MITYEVAYETAKKLKPNIDSCYETENGYVFSCKEDELWDGGAGHSPVVVLKEDGRAVSMPYFVKRGTGKEIRSFDL